MSPEVGILVAALTTLYMGVVRRRYRRMVDALLVEYGPSVWGAPMWRRTLAIRALLWVVPSGIYHWRERLWRKKSKSLKDERETECDT